MGSTLRYKGRRVSFSIFLIFFSISVFSVFFTYIGLTVQSAVRSYVAGEGLWSKAQRDATYNLHLYGDTRDPVYLEKFREALAIPRGLETARLALLQEDFDEEVAVRGLLVGGTHPDDVFGVIQLFRCCQNHKYFKIAIRNWAIGDSYVRKLETLAELITAAIEEGSATADHLPSYLKEIRAISRAVRTYENAFTSALGDAARQVTKLLFLTTCLVIGGLISIGAYLSLLIARNARFSEEQYRLLFNSARDAICVIDRATNSVIEVNDKTASMTGQSSATLSRRRFHDIFSIPENVDLGSTTGQRFELSGDAPGRITLEMNSSLTEWHGKPAYLAIMRDVSDHIRFENTLRVSANAMANMAEGVAITDSSGNIISINSAFTAITGFEANEVLNTPLVNCLMRNDRRTEYHRIVRVLAETGSWRGDIQSSRTNGEPLQISASFSVVQNKNGQIENYIAVIDDITVSKGYEKQLLHVANHDVLTQLPNRSAFHERCNALINEKIRSSSAVALLFIDLDGFKLINDTYGHAVGDHVLRSVAAQITASIRKDDFIARLGGDEFVVLLAADDIDATAATVANKVLEGLSKGTTFSGQDLTVLASIGISVFPRDATTTETLLTTADTAMYEAKHKGRNNYQFYEAGMTVDAASRLRLLSALKHAVTRDELELFFQPCIDLLSGRIVGLEALLRWNHRELGLISPDRFILLAEETGLIGPITDWVVRNACRQVMQWRAAGIPTVPIAVNISPFNFWDGKLPEKIRAILTETGCPASMICLEITENAMMNRQKSSAALKELNALGLNIAIDDFGVGYSSLSYLKDFPVQFLKIDKSFMIATAGDESNAAIIRTILALASSLNLRVIAEGVETREQRDFLVQAGCHEAQGYLFERPVRQDAIERHLIENASTEVRRPSAPIA